jgi:hypothetical protein
MITRLQSLFAATLTFILASGSLPASAQQTNEPGPAPKAERKVFFFEGGRPIDLIMAIDRHFRTRMQQILSIPSSLARATVPKMKVVEAKEPTDPLWVYNNLHDPTLGEWKWQGPARDPAVLALVPDKEAAMSKKPGTLVRAFSLGGLPKDSWGSVEADIESAQGLAHKVTPEGTEECHGSIHIQPDSKVLIAGGTDTYVNMVESVIAAHLANVRSEVSKSESK